MQSSLTKTVASILVSGMRGMRIPAQLLFPDQSLKAINIRALVDSGANISCIDWDFVKKHRLPRTKLATPIPVVDESANKTRVIWYTCTLFLHIEGITMEETLHVMHCGNENVIIGRPWLKKTNPRINCVANTMVIEEFPPLVNTIQQRTKEKPMKPGQTPFGNHPHPKWKLSRPTDSLNMLTINHQRSSVTEPTLHICIIERIAQCGSRFLQTTTIARISHALEPEVSLPPEYSAFQESLWRTLSWNSFPLPTL